MRRAMLPLAVLLVLGVAGCTKADPDRGQLLAALDRTEQGARSFTYTETYNGHQTVVQGQVADDFRYSVDATIDGHAAASEVMVDDRRAVRLEDQSLIAAMRTDSRAAQAATGLPPAGGSTVAGINPAALPDAVLHGAWAVDPKAGLSIIPRAPGPLAAQDPVYSALTTLEYARAATNKAITVQRFNADSANYRPKLDPFPRPGVEVVRYDLVAPGLPQRQGAGGGLQLGNQQPVPDTSFFRLMSIYVKGGMVRAVRERISIEARLDDVTSNLQDRLSDYIAVPAGSATSQEARLLLPVLNRRLSAAGRPAIRQHDLVVSFGALAGGKGPKQLTIPTGATTADLSGIGDYGLLLLESR